MHSRTRSRKDEITLGTQDQWSRFLDVLGVALFAGGVAWMWWTSAVSGGSAEPGVGLLLGCSLALLATRAMGSRAQLLVPAGVLLAVIVIASGSRTGVLSDAPLSGPLEYVNADAALYIQAVIAGLMLATSPSPGFLRVFGGVGAGVFVTLPFIIHAVAAAWLVVVLPAIAILAVAFFGARGARAAVVLCGLLVVASVAATIWLGGSYSTASRPGIFQRTALTIVDRDRLIFWHEAFDIMKKNPATGVGPSRYQVVSPVARSDPDDRWAHNEFLQQGAEGGIAGLSILVLIFLWGFSRLWLVRIPDLITALSAASLAALGIHACVDYVVHFPAIPILTAALVATGMIDPRTPSSHARPLSPGRVTANLDEVAEEVERVQ